MSLMDNLTNLTATLKHKKIRQAIQEKYAEVAGSAAGKFQYPTGKAGAELLGYDPRDIRDAPEQLLESFCGVGNPFSLGDIGPGETVLDIGCGAGFDLLVASRKVGPNGRVYGVDMTQEMVGKAAKGLAQAGATNFDVRFANVEELPFEESTFEVVISNGVLNLSPSKSVAFREIYRVLKPNGRLQFADIVLREELPAGIAGSADAWSQ